MGQDPSDAALTVDGVTVTPTWKWSREYRAQVADELRRATKGDILPEETERRYIAWYAQEHGLTPEEARLRVKGARA